MAATPDVAENWFPALSGTAPLRAPRCPQSRSRRDDAFAADRPGHGARVRPVQQRHLDSVRWSCKRNSGPVPRPCKVMNTVDLPTLASRLYPFHGVVYQLAVYVTADSLR